MKVFSHFRHETNPKNYDLEIKFLKVIILPTKVTFFNL